MATDDGSHAAERLPPARVQLCLLGQFRATVDGAEVSLGGPRQRAVLVALAIARGELVAADTLVEALWGADPPADPYASLQSFVSRLRARLRPTAVAGTRGDIIVSSPRGYALRLGADEVDAWEFEGLVREGSAAVDTDPAAAARQLTAGLALWRGPALPEYAAEPWAEAEVARLTALRAAARERLFAARLATDDPGLLVADLQSLVDEEPLREERWRLLVLALYRAHRQADALAALRRARALLADELGVDPGTALRSLEEQVLAQSPALEPPAPGLPAAEPQAHEPRAHEPPAREPATAATATAADDLVERQRELRLLEACLATARSGTGSLAFVEGPAGIGKSRLLAEFRRRAGEEAVVLHARASPLEQEFSFGVARQLLEPFVVEPGDREALLRGAAAAAAPVFDLSTSSGTADDSSFATLHGLYWLMVNIASRRPVVVLVDDLHWCDNGSLRFLAYLTRRLDGLPAAIVTAHRTGEQHPLAAVVDDLRHDVGTVLVSPGPLTEPAVATMIRARLGADAEPEFIAACFEQTGGNPLLVRQLLRALEADGLRPTRSHADAARAIGSRAVSSMVLLRLRRLTGPATAVARALAVLGDGAPLPLVAELSGLTEGQAADVTAHLVAAEIVRPDLPLGFVHALVRDAVYGDAPPGERELLHDAAAHLLSRWGRSDEQIAAQLLQAPRRGDPWVVEVLRRAAKEAVRRGSADGAVTFLTRALAEPATGQERAAVLLELGIVETSTDGPAAGRDLQAAYDSLVDPHTRAVAALALTRTLVFVGALGAPVTFAAGALATLPAHLVDERASIRALQRIGGHMHGVDATVWGFHAEPDISGDGYGARMLEAVVAYERMCRTESRDVAVPLARQALADGQLFAHDPGLLWVWAQCVLDLADEDVLPMWDTINAASHERGSLFSVLAVRLWQGYALMRRGELAEAEQSIRAAIEQLDTWQRDAMTMAYARAFLARVLIDQGKFAEARVVVGSSRAPISALDGDRLVAEVDGALLLHEGRPEEALRRLEQVTSRLPQVTNPAWRRDRLLWCLAMHAVGRTEEAIARAESSLALARTWGAATTIGEVLLVLGRVRGADGLPHLREAVAVLRDSPVKIAYADALIALGAAVAADAPGEAASLLHEAHAIGCRAGAGRVIDTARETLVALALPVPADLDTDAELTSTERRILKLVETGASLHEVGQRLFMTPSTVQRHLDSARRRSLDAPPLPT